VGSIYLQIQNLLEKPILLFINFS